MIRRLAILFLLLCATTQAVLSIFFVNLSFLDLAKYGAGTENLPFQRRLLMVPFVRWAGSSHALQAAAHAWAKRHPQFEPLTSAKLGCIVLSLVLVNALGLWTIRMAPKLGIRHWWLLWTLIVGILFASYGARFEQGLWYPYDLPHMVVFGAGTVFVLVDAPWAFLAAIGIDAFLRETSAGLLVLAALLYFRSRRWQVAIAVGTVFWVFGQWLGRHLYPHNFNPGYNFSWLMLGSPWNWTQILSIVGYLWIPVWLGAKCLQPKQRLALYGATAVMLILFYWAVWDETRVWIEWTVLFATLGALEIEALFGHDADPRTSDRPV